MSAQKRMFDKAIIDTDRFMDLSLGSKALYFLLGMEADDEGFVSYKKVMRIHGGQQDDLNVLVLKNFLIAFKSGVVVITDWNKNNYLDKNRIKETEYQKEKKLLLLTDNKEYVLNKGLTRVEESSIEENRGVQNRIEEIPQLEDNSLSYLDSLPKEESESLSLKFKCEPSEVTTKSRTLADYCRSKGKRYKDYRAFLSNALRRDYGERPPKSKVPIYDTSSGVAKVVGYK